MKRYFIIFLLFSATFITNIYAADVLIEGRNIRGNIDNVTSISMPTSLDGTHMINVSNSGDLAGAVEGDCWWNKALSKFRCRNASTIVTVGPP